MPAVKGLARFTGAAVKAVLVGWCEGVHGEGAGGGGCVEREWEGRPCEYSQRRGFPRAVCWQDGQVGRGWLSDGCVIYCILLATGLFFVDFR